MSDARNLAAAALTAAAIATAPPPSVYGPDAPRAPLVVTPKKYESPHLPPLGVAQSIVWRSTSRYVVLVAGRRFGKSTLLAQKLFLKAYTNKGTLNWYVAPTYRQAKGIFWERLKETIPKMYVLKRNESELSITLKNYSRIELKGADNPDSLRGPGLKHVSFDEFQDIDPKAWTTVIRPSLSEQRGTADFVGSAKGFNHLYDYFNKGTLQRDDPRNRNYHGFLYTTVQGGRVPLEEIEEARNELDHKVFRQEYLASFETLIGRVYESFNRFPWPRGNCDEGIIDIQRELYIGMDFNVNPMSAVVVQDVLGKPEVLDAVELMTSDTEEMAKHLLERYGRTSSGEKRRLIVCPDASGQARHTSSPMGQTDLTILRSYGFEIMMDNSNPFVADRINNVQSNLRSGSGFRRARIHPRAQKLVKALEGLTWKEGTSLVDKKSKLVHITDAFGYVLWQRFNVLAKHVPAVVPELGERHDPYEAAG